MFDLARYLKSAGVPYIERGPNVQRDNINIKCPFCVEDPSMHMGISLTTGRWGCWRDSSHRGSKPGRLLRYVLGISWDEVERIVGGEKSTTTASVEDLEEALKTLGPQSHTPIETVEFPSFFKCISDEGYSKPYWSYLQKRGFSYEDTRSLVREFDLRYTLTGDFAYRVIIPIRFQEKLIGWTARAIVPAAIRYLSFPRGDLKDQSAIKRILFNYDRVAEGGQLLTACEGPLDAMKVDFYGASKGIRSIGTLGVSLTPIQVSLIAKLSGRFDRIGVLLDSDAQSQAVSLWSRLSCVGGELLELPRDVKDPGEMNRSQVLSLVQ